MSSQSPHSILVGRIHVPIRNRFRLVSTKIAVAILICQILAVTNGFPLIRNVLTRTQITFSTRASNRIDSQSACKLRLSEKNAGFRENPLDISEEISEDLTKELQRLENGRGVIGKALRKGLTRQLKRMGPSKDMQKVLRKRMQARRGTSTLFLVSNIHTNETNES